MKRWLGFCVNKYMGNKLTIIFLYAKLHCFKAVLFILGLTVAISCTSKKKSSEVNNDKLNDSVAKVEKLDTASLVVKKDSLLLDTAKVKIKVQQEQYIKENHPVAYGTGVDEYKVIIKNDED